MTLSAKTLFRGISWTVAAYAGGQIFRFAGNVVLARLLAPEIFGLIAIVHSVRNGIELISDVGIGQNIIYHQGASVPEFYNTAWSLQIIRGLVLWPLTFLVAGPIAHFYNAPELTYVLPVASLPFIFIGVSSMGRYFAQKRIQFIRLSLFELALELISSTVNVIAALISPTIWALVSGLLASSIARMVGSYFLVPGLHHRFRLSREYIWQILGFSKWIFLSSIIFFVSSNFDSLYLGKAGTLALLGVYGIARTLSQQVVALVGRLNTTFVFPYVASANDIPRHKLRERIAPIRAYFFLATACGLSLIAVSGDMIVDVLYDHRYQSAGWMLPILIIGAWFSILSGTNESILLGFGRPSYAAFGSSLKLAWLLVGLPAAYKLHGPVGAVFIIGVSDVWRYLPGLLGLRRHRFSFITQDIFLTIALFGFVVLWESIRWATGFGISTV